jgi:hypothetical protein
MCKFVWIFSKFGGGGCVLEKHPIKIGFAYVSVAWEIVISQLLRKVQP